MPDRLLLQAYRGLRRLAAGARRHTVHSNDGRLWPVYHVEPSGRMELGVPVVMFHGFGNDGSTWFPFMGSLGVAREMAAPDLPAFGRHELGTTEEPTPRWYRQVAGALLRELTARWGQPPIVVGKSMGGMIAGLVASDMPELVRKLVLIDPAGIETPVPSRFWRVWSEGTNLLLPSDEAGWDRMVDVLYASRPRIPGFLRREALRTIARRRETWERVFAGLLSEGFDPLGSRLHRIECPVAVIWGARDEVMDPSGIEVVRERLPSARIEVVPDCGHSPTRERPQEVLRILTGVLQRYG